MLEATFVKNAVQNFLEEDGFYNNYQYMRALPADIVEAQLKFKSEMTVAGISTFFECFNSFLDNKIPYNEYLALEGKDVRPQNISFKIPFSVGLTLERVALNLLNRMSSIATTTRKLRNTLKNDIQILDTRKTTPGLRAFEKYAVLVGGGKNHRYNQVDVFMVKDNHKSFFGGLKEAVDFFKEQGLFYNSMIVEIHSLTELEEALELGIRHLMLDNFNAQDLDKAITMKKEGITYEVSGGVNFENISTFDKEGIDALSVGMLTQNPLKVDISLKLNK